MGGPVRFRVVPPEAGMPLAQLLVRRLPEMNASAARQVVRKGGVYVGRHRVRLPQARVAAGERITVYPEAAQAEPLPLSALSILYEDAHLVIVDKPPGVPTTATRQAAVGTLAEAVRRYLAASGVARPYVGEVHRLDLEASGAVIFAVRSAVERSLHRRFQSHRIARTYRLKVQGIPPASFEICAPLTPLRGGRVRVAEGGRPARTCFERLSTMGEGSGSSALLAAHLETGRTHQIRAHAAHAGHPIVGDALYGGRDPGGDGGRLHLHALTVAFTHPVTGVPVEVTAPPPAWAVPPDPARPTT